MTNDRPADKSLAAILGPPPTERERELIVRVTLLENYAFELQEANDRLGRLTRDLLNEIASLNALLKKTL
jgi:hypothetical protein